MIKNLLIYLFNLPLYYIMYFIPVKQNLWVFGAWFGEKYFDNPRFLFEYMKINNKNIKVIWITKDISICNQNDIIYKYSIKGFYFSLIGEVYIVTHSTLVDIYPFINGYRRKIIQLWHGIPIKRIGKDDNKNIQNNFKSRIKLWLFPFLQEKYSLVIASSLNDQENMASAFDIDISKVKITGYPRNDIFESYKVNYNIKYKILYAPTLRDGINDEVNLFDDFKFDSRKVLDFLKKHEIYLDIKMHPVNKIDSNFKNSINSKYINFLESKIEINQIIGDYSLLISDYSGIFVDYLLTDRPIIFSPFDYEKYITKDRELYYNYEDITPGPKCKDWEEVILWIKKFKEDQSLFKREREAMKNKFHKYQDGKSCKRVYENILGVISGK